MAKLNKVSFDEETLNSLAKIKVFSELEFVQTDVDKLANHSHLSVKRILELKHEFVSKCYNLCTDGLSTFEAALRDKVLPTSIENLDELLEGGLRSGDIYEICGLSSSGKSQLCMTVAVNAAYFMKTNVLYIDTKGDASATCLESFLRHICRENDNLDDTLEKIDIVAVRDIYEMLSTLHNLRREMENVNTKTDYKLIIVDSMTVLYFPYLGLVNKDGFSLLNSAVCSLRDILSSFRMAAIVTNLGTQYYDFDDGKDPKKSADSRPVEVKPLLGKYWSHVANTRLTIKKSAVDNSQRILKIVKSCTLPVGNSCTVSVSERGIVMI